MIKGSDIMPHVMYLGLSMSWILINKMNYILYNCYIDKIWDGKDFLRTTRSRNIITQLIIY
jgi:hypothetical protein